MRYSIWDVCYVLSFPNQENNNEYTARPVIIVEDLSDIVAVVPITSKVHQESRYQYCIKVPKESSAGMHMGIDFDSLIVLDREVEIRKISLHGRIGTCPDEIVKKIEMLIEKKRKDLISNR